MSERTSTTWQVEDRGDYLLVALIGATETEADMLGFQQAIERGSTEAHEGRVLFDNREAQPAPEDLRAAFWTWLTVTPYVRRAAVLAHGARIKRRVDSTAALNRVVFRGFHDFEEAETWLRRGHVVG